MFLLCSGVSVWFSVRWLVGFSLCLSDNCIIGMLVLGYIGISV